jgi:zinc protease
LLPSAAGADLLPPLSLTVPQAMSSPPVRTVLDNGLRALCVENPSTQTVALSLFITTTARAESLPQAGIRYFVARALTDCNATDQPAIARGLDDLGAETLAGAGVDFTEITLLAMAEDVGPAAKLLRAIAFQPHFEPTSLGRLRTDLAVGLARGGELPEMTAERTAAARLYPNHPFGWPVEGLATSVAGLTVEDVKRVYSGSYLANNMIVVAAGGLKPEASLAAVREAFGSILPGSRLVESSIDPPPAHPSQDTLRRPGSAAVVYLGARAPGVSDPRYAPATIVLAMLGSGLGSRLYQVLRREASLAYTVRATAITARAGARAGLLVSCPPERVAEVEARMLREVERVTREAPTTEEIQRAKEYICTSYALGHQRNADLAHALGAFEVAADQGYQLDRDLPRLVRQATPEDIVAAARSMFETTALVRVAPS